MSPKRIVLALPLVVWGLSCAPRPAAPPGVRSLRHQRHRATIVLPVWDMDAAEEVATHADDYKGKTLVIQRAHLSPEREIALGDTLATFPLRGGGAVTIPVEQVPAWLQRWTGAPLTIRATVHPPRPGVEGAAGGPLLTASALDFAHPLELVHVQIERGKDGASVTAHVENLRGEPASATLELRFGAQQATRKVGPVEPGKAAAVRLPLFAGEEPRWRALPADQRCLRLRFADGSAVTLDLARWLDAPAETLLDWGYTFTPPANAAIALSADAPEAELERFAALELRSYLAQFTDANIEPREPGAAEPLPPGLPLLVVGTAGHNPIAAAIVRQAQLEPRLQPLGPEGYLLKSLVHEGRPALLVAANTPRGLVHGVYGLLEHYGVRFTMHGARLPASGKFRLVEVDEARVPVFARRRLVATGREPSATSRWSQWQWITLFDLAAKNRYNEVVFPLDGLEATFTYAAGKSRDAIFPFDIGPYACLAEAYLAHERGLAILADYAHRRGLALTLAHRDADGTLKGVVPPACVAAVVPAREVGQLIESLADHGDRFALPRIEEAAQAGAELLRKQSSVLSVPYSHGSRSRASFLAKLAWDKDLTPNAYFRGFAATLCQGEAVDQLADAFLALDQLDTAILAALPEPLGLGPALATPLQAADLTADWAKLKARATDPALANQLKAIKEQSRQLRDLGSKLEPIHDTVRKALGTVAPPWEEPLFESASATDRAQRIVSAFYRFRGLLGGLASAQEGALACTAALAEPEEALPRLVVAAGKYATAQQLVAQTARHMEGTGLEPVFARVAAQIADQQQRLADWLGPIQDATPVARLRVQGSDAVIHLFRKERTDLYAAYKLAGQEVVQLQLPTATARVLRHGEPSKTVTAEGGLFLLSLDTTPTYLIARHTGWPGQP